MKVPIEGGAAQQMPGHRDLGDIEIAVGKRDQDAHSTGIVGLTRGRRPAAP